jgi:hypothetical protein
VPPIATQTDPSKPEVFGERLVSGVVPAEKQPDGTVRVKNLPIFSEIRPDDPGVKVGLREPRDREWLERAFKKHQARRVLGQKPALNLRHLFDEPERVGEYELTGLDLAEVNPGEPPRWTLFGDKVYESVEAFEKAKDHDFRSAEISPDSPDELSALALLRSKMPCFRYPNVKERLAPQLVEAFESWSGKGWQAPQVWSGAPETFEATHMGVGATATNFAGAKDPYAIANSMFKKGEITKARFDDVVSAIERGTHGTKEGGMADPAVKTDDKKSPSIDEKMEAMAAAFMEKLSKHFESLMKDKYGEKKDEAKAESHEETAKDSTKKAGGTEEPETPKKTEAAEASHVPDALPAVSQAAPGETFAALAAKNGVGLLSSQEKLELLGLRSYVQHKQKEEQVEQFAAAGEKSLMDAGVQLDDEVRSILRAKAKADGKSGVDGVVTGILHYAKNAARAPEAFGALAGLNGGAGAPTGSAFDADVKKAVETFGATPDRKQRVYALAAQARENGELFVRSLAPGEFFSICQGDASINPAIMGPRGGFRKGN